MKNLEDTVRRLCAKDDEQEWFEFKENWFEPVQLGEYVSALSNAAAYHQEDNAYFIWGVNDKTHEIVGTNFNQYCDYNKEPYQNYLARKLSPSIGFEFEDLTLDEKKVVVLTIPAAKNVPTSFNESRYIRIGSSKANLKDYSEREKKLSRLLDQGIDTIENKAAEYQNLTFRKLSEIFIQLHISEKSGRGVPKIVETYGRDAFTFEENAIVVMIPFNWINKVGNKAGNKVGNNDNPLNETRRTIIAEMRNNPNVTKAELSRTIGISTTAIDNNIAYLKKNGYIERIGSNKTGYWKVMEKS